MHLKKRRNEKLLQKKTGKTKENERAKDKEKITVDPTTIMMITQLGQPPY